VNIDKYTMGWFKRQWLKLKSLYRLWTMHSDPIPVESRPCCGSVSFRTYYSPSGLDSSVYLGGQKLATAHLIDWDVNDDFKATLHLVQTMIFVEGEEQKDKLEPGMNFSDLEVKCCSENGEVRTLAKFKDIHFTTMHYAISVDDLVTEKTFSMSGTFIPEHQWGEA